MRILYSFLLAIAFIALLPVFAYQAIFKRKYLGNLRQRLGFLPESLKVDARSVIWMHAVSVGETLAARSLVKALRARFPQHRVIVSTTTITGQAVARSQIAEADGVCFFPFDWKFAVRRALDALRPQIVVLMESELWFNFLDECQARKIPVIVANGRISDRSFARSRKFPFFLRRLYAIVTRFAMQSALDAERAIALGAPQERVTVTGNLKYDLGEAAEIADKERLLDELFDLRGAPLVVAGSTHEGEERIVIAAFRRLKEAAELKNVRLLVAPRHPDRFGAVAQLLKDSQVTFARRTAPGEESRRVECILLDSIGELAAVYSLASVVFIGGSIVPVGGHNILEPAAYAKPIITGSQMHNFREITEEFLRRDAMMQLKTTDEQELSEELAGMLKQVLTDAAYAQRLGTNARQAVEENRGATAQMVSIIAEIIGRQEAR